MIAPSPALLCVCNYPANTGYAWDFIEGLYAGVAARLAPLGVRTFVAYPEMAQPPRTLVGSAASAVALDATLTSARSVAATCAFVRREHVSVVYLTDQPLRSRAYATVRRAGARRIVVHDHSSGSRSVPTGLRRLIKWCLARIPRLGADDIVAVSDFVARRQVATALIPPARITRVWNGIPLPTLTGDEPRLLREAFNIASERPVVVCACRAAAEKGVPHLLRAFDGLLATWPPNRPRPVCVYMGDGPQLAEIRALHAQLAGKADIRVPGYHPQAGLLQAGADVCAMPSVWQDALPLAVMQPMAAARPVVGSRVGGIPEMIVDGESGLLVPPSDEAALAEALRRLLLDPALARRLGDAARERVAVMFTPEAQLEALTRVVLRGFPSR